MSEEKDPSSLIRPPSVRTLAHLLPDMADAAPKPFKDIGKAPRPDNKFDLWFKGGKMDTFFKVTERGSNATTEIRAGCTTYLTAAYIMAVNPNILSVTGLNFEGLVFATAMSSFVATLIMALWANLPFGLWPGMGMNAYFAYTVVGFKGTQHAAKKVMFAVMIEGVVFIVLSLLDVRRKIFKVFPVWLMKSSMAGIGLFLAFIGLQAGNGVDIIRDHPAVLVDFASISVEHHGRTWVGIAFFLVMSTLVMLRVRGAVMIGILLSAFTCWILEAGGAPHFKYQPMCCLGSVTFPPTGSAFPQNNGWYPKPGGGDIPKPTCVNPYTVPGQGSSMFVAGTNGADDFYTTKWTGSTVTGTFGAWTIDGTTTHSGSLLFAGNGDGRDSSFKGGCDDACHGMFGGFNPACFGSVLIETGCWPGLSVKENDANTAVAMGAVPFADSGKLTPYTVVDGFGEGCLGGAGRIPKTFKAPTGLAAAPKAAMAGPIVPAWPGWFGCDANGQNCWSGNVQGGTFWAFDTEGLTWDNFGQPLLVLLYVDFIGTMAFLYAAADLSGLIDPKTPDNFPGCYAAFMADAVGTFLGGFLGTSSVTTYGESMAGIYEGGRTGMTALVIAFLNFLSMFFTPFFSSIPTISTGPALVMVGAFMIEGVKDIDWTDYMQSIPSMICILLQPVTYHIEIGVLAGLFVWGFMMIASLRFTLSFPPLWNALPTAAKNFVARQRLDAGQKKKLEALGYSSQSAVVSNASVDTAAA